MRKRQRTDKIERGHNDCLTACVAKYLRIPEQAVPLFVEHDDWEERVRRFFRRRGKRIRPYPYRAALLANKRTLYLVQGRSGRNRRYEHMVIYRGRVRWFDPSPKQRWLFGRPSFVWIIETVKPQGEQRWQKRK